MKKKKNKRKSLVKPVISKKRQKEKQIMDTLGLTTRKQLRKISKSKSNKGLANVKLDSNSNIL